QAEDGIQGMGKAEARAGQGHQQAKKEENKVYKELAPAVDEFHAERAGAPTAYLYSEAGDIGGNKHTAANRFARQYAEDRQRHQAKLLDRFGHPFPTPG